MTSLLRGFLGVALLTGAAAMSAAPVLADVTISITPSVLNMSADPGSEGATAITVTNNGDEPFEVAVAVAAYREIEGDRSAVDWLSIEPESISLEPGASAPVEVAIVIPDDLEAGGRYAAVSFITGAAQSDVEENPQGAGAAFVGGVVVPVRIAVTGEGDLSFEATVDRFAPVLEPDGRIGFRAEVTNDGNVHGDLGGAIGIGLEGQQIGNIAFAGKTVLPDETVLLSTEGTLPLPASRQYEATASFAPVGGDGADPVTAESTFGLEPELALDAAAVCENLDRGPTVASVLDNQGEIGVLPQFVVELRDGAGEVLGSTPVQTDPVAWPQDTVDLMVDLPEALPGGAYTVVTRVAYGYQQTIEQETPFQIGGDPATAAPLCENPFLDAATPEAGA